MSGSAIPWVPALPAHWRIEPFLTVFRETKTRNAGLAETNLLSLSFGRVVPKDITASEGLLPESFETYQIVDPGQLVFRFTDLQNDQRSLRSALVRQRGIITSAYGAARPIGLTPEYADYLLRSYDLSKVFYGYGGGVRQSLKLRDIGRMPIIVPPREEQRAIAGYLDRETAQIDALIAKQKQLISTLHERRLAEVRRATGWGGQPRTHWTRQRLSWVFEATASGTTPAPEDLVEPNESTIPWVTTGELRERSVTSTRLAVTVDTVSKYSALRVHPAGSLLVAMYGATIGRMAILGVDATTNQACCALIGPIRATARFVEYSMLAARETLLLDAAGGGQPNINQDKLRSFRIPLPPANEQGEIVAELDTKLSKIDSLIMRAERFIELSKERRGALITAAVTGQIDVTGKAA